MGDYAIRMQFDVAAEPSAVRAALTTAEGIRGWWSDRVEGDLDASGGTLRVSFPDLPRPFVFAVEHVGDEVVWRTGEYPPWWRDTTIRWRVEADADGGGTLLRFGHGGFEPEAEIIPVITPAWADIISRLRRYAESGDPDPFAVNTGAPTA